MPAIDPAEFQELGLLQEVNRRLLHPLGLALYVVRDEDGSVTFGGVCDWRDDPEGVRFEGVPLAERAARVDALWAERAPARQEALGYVVQPVAP